jgi:mannose-6-phosphate isomerase-like protein (cupin superfamily)
MKKLEHINLRTFTNRGFNLTPVEFKDVIPFEVKRLYYIDNLPSGTQTGEHCHYKEEEVFIVTKGAVTAIIDQGNGKEDMRMEGPNAAIYVPNYVWHGFKDATNDCVIIALSSTNYSPDRSDYLENYDEYLKVRDNN